MRLEDGTLLVVATQCQPQAVSLLMLTVGELRGFLGFLRVAASPKKTLTCEMLNAWSVFFALLSVALAWALRSGH